MIKRFHLNFSIDLNSVDYDDDDDDESDKYDEEPGNCLEMEEGVHLVTRTATAAAPSDLSGQTFLG